MRNVTTINLNKAKIYYSLYLSRTIKIKITSIDIQTGDIFPMLTLGRNFKNGDFFRNLL